MYCDCFELSERHEHDDECCACPCHADEHAPDYDQLGKDEEIHREQFSSAFALPMMNHAVHARLTSTSAPDVRPSLLLLILLYASMKKPT